MTKVALIYSKNQIRKAGDVLAGRDITMSIEDAFMIMNNWRSYHNFPLNTMQMNLRQIARRFSRQALVAQRLKRSESIINKLRLFPNMPLSNMQDIAGCRAIMPTMKEVNEIVDYLENRTTMQHEKVKITDYIENPKSSGYRSIHIIYRYSTKDERASMFSGVQIEMQIRSMVQHSWATAVETAGMFLDTALKSNQGPDEWKRFFVLSGSMFAFLEDNPIEPSLGTVREIKRELIPLERQISAIKKLGLYNNSIRIVDSKKRKNDKYYILELDSENKKLVVNAYSRDQFDIASANYAQLEINKGSKDIVLVSADSISMLKKAYPNYFIDTTKFIDNYKKSLRKISLKK